MAKITTIGDRVKVLISKDSQNASPGVVRFIGELKGKKSVFFGVELDKAKTGQNNGSYKGVNYFKTSDKRGVFINKSQITKTNGKNNAAPRVTVGDKVKVKKLNCFGIIRYIGVPAFKPGKGYWYGIELETAKGKSNGTEQNKIYFSCKPKYGTFQKADAIDVPKYSVVAKKKKKSKKNLVSSPKPEVSSNENDDKINEQKQIIADLKKQLQDCDEEYQKKLQTNMQSKDKEIADLRVLMNMKINRAQIEKNDTNVSDKRNEMEIGINALLQSCGGNGSENALNALLKTYDDKQENEDMKWLKIISNLKAINYTIIELKNNNKNDEKNKKYEKEINRLKDAKFRLQEEVNNLKFNGNAGKYTLEIQQLKADKISLEKQLRAKENEKTESLQNESDNETIQNLKKNQEQTKTILRAKDEIIKNAKKEIERLKEELSAIKEEEQKEILQMDNLSKLKAKELLEKRVSAQQANTLKVDSNQANGGKKQTMSEMLSECTKEDAFNVIYSMNVIGFEYDKKLKRDTYNLNLTNNTVLRRLTNDQRKKFMELLAYCIVDSSGRQKIEKVKMSNMGIDKKDKVFPVFMDLLIENVEHFAAEELELESNNIGDVGIQKLGEFLELCPKNLQTIKMYNNKTSIKTPVINELLTSIEKNEILCKFTFEWRFKQERDRLNKKLNANSDLRRKRKWAKK